MDRCTVHCAGKVLLKKALRKGFNGYIHSTLAHSISFHHRLSVLQCSSATIIESAELFGNSGNEAHRR